MVLETPRGAASGGERFRANVVAAVVCGGEGSSSG
jgi:hypothetical protein